MNKQDEARNRALRCIIRHWGEYVALTEEEHGAEWWVDTPSQATVEDFGLFLQIVVEDSPETDVTF